MIFSSSKPNRSTLQTLSPDEPWRWNPEWAAGVINPNAVRRVMVQWVFTVFWNAIAVVVLFRFFDEWQEGGLHTAVLLIPFVIGLALIVLAYRDTRAWLRFGRSWLHLQSIPGVIGGHVKGQLVLSATFVNSNDFLVQLKALQLQNGDESVPPTVLWEKEDEISPSVFSTTFMKTVPFEFKIPHGLPQTDEDKGIVWRLHVSTKDPKVNYYAEFDLPIFVTKDSDQSFAA